MRAFLYAFLGTVAAILALNLALDPFGLIFTPVGRYIDSNPRLCAVETSLIPEGAQKKMKLWLLSKTKSPNITVGSSRVLKVRRSDFGATGHVSFAFGGLAIDSYPGLSRELSKFPQIQNMLLGLEFYAYGNQAGLSRWIDKLLGWSRKVGLEKATMRLGATFYEWRGSPHFTNPLTNAWNVVIEYLSWPATKRSLVVLSRYVGGRGGFHELPLPKESVVESRCVLSSGSEIHHGNSWDPRDGSEYQINDLLGKDLPMDDFREFREEYWRGGFDAGNHWNLMIGLTAFSEFKLSVLERFLADQEERKVRVLGFTPPFPMRIMEGYRALGLMPLWNEFNRRMEEMFHKHGHAFIALPTSKELGCDDKKDYDDPWHPGRRCLQLVLHHLQKHQAGAFLQVQDSR